jgi:hypothetical protein
VTLLTRALPEVSAVFDATSLWREGLRRSYATEIRVEQPERIVHLIEADASYYELATAAALEGMPFAVEALAGSSPRRYRAHVSRWRRGLSGLAWCGRRWQGKVLSVLRLLIALGTFEGGIAYALWKIERHTGIGAEATPRAHRHPLLAGWRLAWRLYRQRAFR